MLKQLKRSTLASLSVFQTKTSSAHSLWNKYVPQCTQPLKQISQCVQPFQQIPQCLQPFTQYPSVYIHTQNTLNLRLLIFFVTINIVSKILQNIGKLDKRNNQVDNCNDLQGMYRKHYDQSAHNMSFHVPEPLLDSTISHVTISNSEALNFSRRA